MARQWQLGIGWSVAEVAAAKQVYGAQTGTGITIASNVADLVDGTYISPSAQNVPAILSTGNLVMIEKVGRQDWGSVGDRVFFYFGHGTGLYFKKSSASGWKIDVSDNSGTSVGVGTTEYVWASSANVPNISVLREATRVRCWVNGVKEVDVSGISSTAWTAATFTYVGTTVATGGAPHAYIGRILRVSTDVADEYLDPTGLTYQFGVPTGAGMHSGFLTNEFGDVDDWTAGGLADGDTTYNGDAGVASTTYRTYNALADFTLAGALGVMHYSTARGNVAAKDTTGIAGLGDGTSIVEAGSTTYPDAITYGPMPVSFPTAPGGGAWSAFTMNNLEVGFRHDVGALGDACVLTAMAVELFGCTFLSDPTATLRLGPAIGSANSLIL